MVSKKPRREELFGNNNDPPQNKFNSPPPPDAQQQQQSMGKTKMVNEIQQQIKSTFDAELDKLRSEMSSRQRALRDQMESLKNDAEKAMKERNEANEELKRMKELLDKKRDQDGYQQKLLHAINKYAPPEENQYGERKIASRGGVNMNVYEKAFFDKGGKDMVLGGKSLKADSALVPIDGNHGITNYFNNERTEMPDKMFKDNKGIPVFESTPEHLRQTNGYGMSPEIPTINTNIKRQIDGKRLKYEYGEVSDSKTTIKDDDTMDFINKINGVGAKDKGENKFGRQNSLQKKAKELKKNHLNDSHITVNTKNLAEKLDFDAFPSLPDYEGIQSKFLENSGRAKDNDYGRYPIKADSLNTSLLSDTNNGIRMPVVSGK